MKLAPNVKQQSRGIKHKGTEVIIFAGSDAWAHAKQWQEHDARMAGDNEPPVWLGEQQLCATYEQESLSCWHIVAVLNNGGRARKVLTSGRSRNDCGGNLLIFPITQNCVGWWVSCRFATRP